MSCVREQVGTHRASTRTIVASTEFARGLDEVRNGRPFNPDNGSWVTSALGASASSRQRKVRISLADLTPCPFNLFHLLCLGLVAYGVAMIGRNRDFRQTV